MGMQAMQSAQAMVTDMTEPGVRTVAMGRLSLSYGIGMVAGSAAGGLLSAVVGNSGVAALGCALSVAMVAMSRVGGCVC